MMMRMLRLTTRLTLLTLVMMLAEFVLCGSNGDACRCLAEDAGSLKESKSPAIFVSAPAGRSSQRPIEFNSDIRPILSENCFFCHGPDRNKRQADLRLDTKEGLFASSGALPAVTPQKPEESELYRRIVSKDPEHQMPPADSGKVLTEQQIELLKQWIEQGAEFQGHWAFLPVRSVTSSS
ncbi:MAG: c-type cytochrome domain-containing protein, partial [Planctomyces sp.]